jgi:hypothetical protein
MRDKSNTKEREQSQIQIPVQSNPVQQKQYSQNQTHHSSKAETHAIQNTQHFISFVHLSSSSIATPVISKQH